MDETEFEITYKATLPLGTTRTVSSLVVCLSFKDSSTNLGGYWVGYSIFEKGVCQHQLPEGPIEIREFKDRIKLGSYIIDDERLSYLCSHLYENSLSLSCKVGFWVLEEMYKSTKIKGDVQREVMSHCMDGRSAPQILYWESRKRYSPTH